MGKDTKLGQALENAALENINEDIQDIFQTLKSINTNIPEEVKKQLSILKKDIDSLSLALKDVPEQFDLDFGRKINRILDVASDIERLTKSHKKSLAIDLEKVLSSYVNQINERLKIQIKNSFIIKSKSLYLMIFLTSILSSIIGGALVLTAFVFF